MGRAKGGSRTGSTVLTVAGKWQKLPVAAAEVVLARLRALSVEEMTALELNLRPRASALSGFLAEEENLLEIIEADVLALADAGTTPQAVGLRLAQMLLPESSYNYRSRTSMRERDRIPEYIQVRFGAFFKGGQRCPFGDEGCGRTCPRASTQLMHELSLLGAGNFEIHNQRTNERVHGPGLLAHLALFHNFFEGGVRYRVDPVALARTMELI